MNEIMTLEDLEHGMMIKAIVYYERINEARICIQNGDYYICQNLVVGSSPMNKLGFRYAYCIWSKSSLVSSRNIERFEIHLDPNNKYRK